MGGGVSKKGNGKATDTRKRETKVPEWARNLVKGEGKETSIGKEEKLREVQRKKRISSRLSSVLNRRGKHNTAVDINNQLRRKTEAKKLSIMKHTPTRRAAVR